MPIDPLHKTKLKKNLTVLALIFGFCALIWIITMVKVANAADSQIAQCRAATTYTLETDPGSGLCDIYTRQLQYREERLKLKKDLEQRRHNFAVPSAQIRAQYQENLEALHQSIDAASLPETAIFSANENQSE